VNNVGSDTARTHELREALETAIIGAFNFQGKAAARELTIPQVTATSTSGWCLPIERPIFGNMKQGQKTTVCLVIAVLGTCAPGQAASAESTANPYQAIVEKNVFRLKPPPPPPAEVPATVPTPKITLTGITTFGKKRAMLKTPPPQVKPGEQPKGEQFFMLAVGERDGEMEMLEIDEVAGAVKVKYAGTEVPLNFVDNGAKPTSVPALPGPGQPTLPGGFIPAPGTPTAQPNIPGARPLPTRTLRLPTPAGGATGYNPATPGTYIPPSTAPANTIQVNTPGGGTATLPSFNLNPGASPVTAPPPPTQQHEQLPADQQMLLMEIQRAQNQNNPVFPPLPPTPMSPPRPY
jgi:hypothetical protein